MKQIGGDTEPIKYVTTTLVHFLLPHIICFAVYLLKTTHIIFAHMLHISLAQFLFLFYHFARCALLLCSSYGKEWCKQQHDVTLHIDRPTWEKETTLTVIWSERKKEERRMLDIVIKKHCNQACYCLFYERAFKITHLSFQNHYQKPLIRIMQKKQEEIRLSKQVIKVTLMLC